MIFKKKDKNLETNKKITKYLKIVRWTQKKHNF